MDIICSDECALILQPDGDWMPVARPYYTAPAWVRRAESRDRIEWSAPAMEDDARHALPMIGRVLRRMLPRTPVHAVPLLRDKEGDPSTPAAGWGGLAHWGAEPHILLSQQCSTWRLLDAALHEAWHIVEHFALDAGDRELVHAAVRCGVPLPGDYYNSDNERAARAYASWGCMQLSLSERPEMPRQGRRRTLESIFWEALTGTYAAPSGMACRAFL